MLQIKAGVVIHVDYEITHLAKDGSVKQTCSFINNEIKPEQFHRYGLDTISTRLQYGISAAPSQYPSVVIPVVGHQLKNRASKNSFIRDGATVTLASVVTLNSGAINTASSEIVIKELGIENISRVILIDPLQGVVDGLHVLDGESLQTKLTFMYSFYTNDRTVPLVDDNIGAEDIYYTSEIIQLPYSTTDLDNTNGFNHPTSMNIVPISTNILGMTSANVPVPREDEFQEQFFRIDPGAYRADIVSNAYCPEETTIYGFVLRLNLYGIGVLVRFNRGLPMSSKSRYIVGAYLGWGAEIDGAEDGYDTNTLADMLDAINTGVGVEAITVKRPIPNNDVAIQVNSLTSMEIKVDNKPTISIPSGSSYHSTRLLAAEHGIQIDLYTNRADNKTPSTMDFVRPDANAHVELMADIDDDETLIAPVLIVGGNYNDVPGLTENNWRWDSYYPYMGDGFKYFGYTIASVDKAVTTIKSLGDIHPESVLTTVGRYVAGSETAAETVEYNSEQLIENTVESSSGKSLFYQTYTMTQTVDPSLTNTGFSYRISSDFDTSEYNDWIPGLTSVQTNFLFLDIVPTTVEVAQDGTTEINLTFDSTKHDPAGGELWVDRSFIGDLSPETFDKLSGYLIDVDVSTVGNKTTYALTKPFNSTTGSSNNIYVFGNQKAVNDTNEVGYVKIVNGKEGFKVYNKSGSNITKELFLEENPFLAMGVTLSQPVPEYLFRNKLFSASEAARYFNETISSSLSEGLFSVTFKDYIYDITYAGTLDSKSTNLNSRELYPAIGVNMGGVDPLVPADTVIFTDNDGKDWTKLEILQLKTSQPELFIGDVLWFVERVKLTEGNRATQTILRSDFFDDVITMAVSTNVVVTYAIESVSILENPVSLEKGLNTKLTLTHSPEKATIDSVTWASLDPSIAIVDENGNVTAVEAGDTTIRALVNGLYIATTNITVIDNDLNITCDLATNPSVYMTLDGNEFGLNINDEELSTSASAEATRNLLRDNDDCTVINEHKFTAPKASTVDQTGYMELTGTFDVWVGGILLARDVTASEAEAVLSAHPQLIVTSEIQE